MPHSAVLDDVRRSEALALATYGLGRAAIAKYVGSDAETLDNTAASDPAFDRQLRLATQQFVCRHIDNIQRHAQQSPRFATWLLERLQPEQFARRSPHAIKPAQLKRKFTAWTRAVVAASPPHARETIAKAASELAAREQALNLPDDDCPADNHPAHDHPADAPCSADPAQPAADHPASASGNSESSAAAAMPAPPTPPLPTPTSALPAFSSLPAAPVPLAASLSPDPAPDNPSCWEKLDLPELIATCRANPESKELYDLIVVEVIDLLKQGQLPEAKRLYREATGATVTDAIHQVGRLDELRRVGAFSGDWASPHLQRLARKRAAAKRAAHQRAPQRVQAPPDLTPPNHAPPLPTPTSALPASAASISLAAMPLLCAIFLAGNIVGAGLSPGWADSPGLVPAHELSADPNDPRLPPSAQKPGPNDPPSLPAAAIAALNTAVIERHPPDITPALLKNPPAGLIHNPQRQQGTLIRTRQRRNALPIAIPYKPRSTTQLAPSLRAENHQRPPKAPSK